MKTNLEKWNFYKGELDQRAEVFMTGVIPVIPEKFYIVHPSGSMNECTILKRVYNYRLFFFGKTPTKKEVEEVKAAYENNAELNQDLIYFEYSYPYSESGIARTSIKATEVFENKKAFISKELAEEKAAQVKTNNEEDRLFKEAHKKDVNYNYGANGYKFLGWQNGWKHVYFDEDGKITTGGPGEKPKVSFGYTKEDYPEYGNCLEQKHRRIEVRHNNRGSENTVSCPVCKIYWKYDCSD